MSRPTRGFALPPVATRRVQCSPPPPSALAHRADSITDVANALVMLSVHPDEYDCGSEQAGMGLSSVWTVCTDIGSAIVASAAEEDDDDDDTRTALGAARYVLGRHRLSCPDAMPVTPPTPHRATASGAVPVATATTATTASTTRARWSPLPG